MIVSLITLYIRQSLELHIPGNTVDSLYVLVLLFGILVRKVDLTDFLTYMHNHVKQSQTEVR